MPERDYMAATHEDHWLTTERMALRRFTPDDLDWLAELSPAPGPGHLDDGRARHARARLPSIAGIASVQNHASQHILTKIGLERREERAFAHPAYAAEGPLAFFEREAEAWIAEDQDRCRRLSGFRTT